MNLNKLHFICLYIFDENKVGYIQIVAVKIVLFIFLPLT